MRVFIAVAALSIIAPLPLLAQSQDSASAVAFSRQELRRTMGQWNTSTEFLNPDGGVVRKVEGTYTFRWVVEDKVLSGESAIPELSTRSAILFYLDEARKVIEMASVGNDGRLWVMTGPMGDSSRTTAPFPTASGGKAQLRFTTFNITRDRFESRMEYTEDEGKSWHPGNHQVFIRATG